MTAADDLGILFVHTAVCEAFLGTNGLGQDTFGTATTINCFIDGSRRMVRDADGNQIISETTIYTYPANWGLLPPNSRVTANGAVARVIKSNLNDSGSLDLPDHVAASLT